MQTSQVYESITFFEEWYLRQFGDRALTDNGLRIRNRVEDLLEDDFDYWNGDCPRLYEAACCELSLQAWAHA